MKIVFLTSHFPNSKQITTGIYNLSRARALRDIGCEVKIIAPIGLTPPQKYFSPKISLKPLKNYWKHQNQISDFESIDHFQVFHPKWYWGPKKIFWKFEVDLLHKFIGKIIDKVIKDFEPDLVISSWIHPYGTYSYYIKQKYDVIFFVIAEGSDVLINPDTYPGWEKIEKVINEYCDLVICVSEDMKKGINSKRNLKNLKVVKNGYENRLFYYEPILRKENKKRVDIISVGNHNYVKGHDILLNAMKLLDNNYHLTLIGSGVLSKEYEKFVEANRLKNRIHFLRQIEHHHIRIYLQKSDIFCMPSRSEGLPTAPLEAMACGLPVVASNVGGLREIIIDGFNGFFCKPGAPEELAKIIEKTARTEWKNEEIANWVREKNSWNKWAKDILISYEEIKPRK